MRKQLSKPSFVNGFARSRGESVRPDLWDGLLCLICPSLGTQGSTLYNLSGGPNGVNNGAVWTADGLDFEASEADYISVPLVYNLSNLTVYYTYKPESTVSNAMHGVRDGNYRLVTNIPSSGNYQLATGDGTNLSDISVTGLTLPTLNVWNTIFFRRESTTLQVFCNGTSKSATGTVYNAVSSGDFYIGKRRYATGEYPHDGIIGIFGLWSRALNQQDILALTADPLLPLRRKKQWSMYVPSTPSGVVLPVFMNHYRNQRIA